MADPRERLNDHQEATKTAIEGHQAGMWTALPAIVTAVNLAALTVSAQPAIQGKLRSAEDQTLTDVTMPLCVDVPLVFPRGGGFCLTFPVAVGDEVLLVFASRCIDGWWQEGGVQPQLDARMHDLSDAFAIPGPWSQKTKPTAAAMTFYSTQLRSLDGTVKIELTPNSMQIQAPTITLIGNVQIAGSSLTHNGKNVGSTHIHGGVLTGGGNTGAPA